MQLQGSYIIAASRYEVWEKLNDPEVLRACIPGCEELTGSTEDGFSAVVKQKIGPVRATFKGTVEIEDADPPNAYRIAGEGKGGVAGFAKGVADIVLTEVPEGTELSYEADAQVGGKLAQLGNRLVGGVAKTVAEKFFGKFAALAEGQDPDAPEPSDEA